MVADALTKLCTADPIKILVDAMEGRLPTCGIAHQTSMVSETPTSSATAASASGGTPSDETTPSAAQTEAAEDSASASRDKKKRRGKKRCRIGNTERKLRVLERASTKTSAALS